MKIKFEWDPIGETGNMNRWTWRAKVIGGWLVREDIYRMPIGKAITDEDEYAISSSMVFVSDPQYEWEIDED